MQTCLIICRTPGDIPILQRFEGHRPIIVASDDPYVHEIAEKMQNVQRVCYLEKIESFFVVAPEVRRLIEQIDAWLVSLDPLLTKETLEWGLNVEGGITNQRVQDSLLLIRSYQDLFVATEAGEVQVIANPAWAWADQVLEVCAQANGIKFTRLSGHKLACWGQTLLTLLRPWAIAAYYVVHETWVGGLRLRRPAAGRAMNDAIIFQVCSSSKKHVDNVRHLMAALADRDQKPVALCWTSSEPFSKRPATVQLAECGLEKTALESFITLPDIMASFWHAAQVWRQSRRRRESLDALQYAGVQLSSLLAESLRHHMIATLPQRIRYARALNACLAGSKPLALKPWGGGDFFQGKAALRVLKANPLYIHYWLGAGLEWPYTDYQYKPDLFLAKSPYEAGLAIREYDLTAAQVEIVGVSRYTSQTNFKNDNTPEASRRLLNLPVNGRFYIGIDPGGFLRGYMSYREQIEILTAGLKAASEQPGIVVVIKPHPSYPIDHLLPLVQRFKEEGIFILSKNCSAEYFLRSIDILVTKYSTLILEAAVFERPVVSAILDREERFKVFGDLPEVVKSGAELTNLLVRLAADDAVFAVWKNTQLARCKQLLPEFIYQTPRSPAQVAAEAVLKHLSNSRNITCRQLPRRPLH